MKKLIAILLLLTCSACNSFIPKNGRQDAPLYTVTSPVVTVAALPATTRTVLVDMPITPLWLDRDRIALRKTANQQDFFAAARWSSPLPNMVQETLINTLEKTGKISAFNHRSGIPTTIRLVTEIRDFQAEYGKSGELVTINVTLTASLLDAGNQKHLTSKTFSAQEKVSGSSVGDMVMGFDKAFSETQKSLVEWVVKTVATAPLKGLSGS